MNDFLEAAIILVVDVTVSQLALRGRSESEKSLNFVQTLRCQQTASGERNAQTHLLEVEENSNLKIANYSGRASS